MRKEVRVIQTAKGHYESTAWKELIPIEMEEVFSYKMCLVNVDSSREYQTILGFGGSFTDSSAHLLAKTSAKNRKEIIEAYFDKEKGLAYNMGRTTIGCCDFSMEPYTFIEEGDVELKTFDMSHDDKELVPLIKEAEVLNGKPLKLLCSPWSPPAFMKSNNDINNGGRLLKKYYKAWAKYLVKYIQGMEERDIPLEMISIQNEPAAKQIWASCKFDSLEEAEFAADYLYPALKEAGLEKMKILIWDHNRDLMYRRVKESMSYPKMDEIVWGFAYHWYCSDKSENLTMVHEQFPNQHLIFTEGCVELINQSGSTSSKAGIGAWKHGETYGRNIINDFNNYNEAWIDWNLVLDETGGPNYVGNYCEAPIHIDTRTDEVSYNWSYYYIGHFSKYIEAGAKRILCRNDVERRVYSAAFKNPNGDIVVVVQNENNRRNRIGICIDGKGFNTELPAHSITTFILPA